jgi:hypothetical protein
MVRRRFSRVVIDVQEAGALPENLGVVVHRPEIPLLQPEKVLRGAARQHTDPVRSPRGPERQVVAAHPCIDGVHFFCHLDAGNVPPSPRYPRWLEVLEKLVHPEVVGRQSRNWHTHNLDGAAPSRALGVKPLRANSFKVIAGLTGIRALCYSRL